MCGSSIEHSFRIGETTLTSIESSEVMDSVESRCVVSVR
jgi:hypothetical protein